MAESYLTKNALAAALKELMREAPFSKITITDICKRCQMNRKSFYYHFKDKYDLVNWIYDTEFIETLSDQNGSSRDFLMEVCSYFYDNRAFYKAALEIEGQNSFSEHFREFLEPVCGVYLREALHIHPLQQFQIDFYVDGFACAIERWLKSSDDPIPPQEFVDGISACIALRSDYQQPLRQR